MISQREQQAAWIARTYRLEADMVATIDELTTAYTAPQSRIVGILLRIGLDELEAGRRYLQRNATRLYDGFGSDTSGFARVLRQGAVKSKTCEVSNLSQRLTPAPSSLFE